MRCMAPAITATTSTIFPPPMRSTAKYDKAKEAARSLLEFKENPREQAQIDNNYSALSPGLVRVDARRWCWLENWDEILDGTSLPVYDRPREQAWRHWAMGVAQAAKGDAAAAVEEARQMDAVLKNYEEQVKNKAAGRTAGRPAGTRRTCPGGAGKNRSRRSRRSKRHPIAQRKLRYSEPRVLSASGE